MDEQYLQDLYNWISSNDGTYQQRYSFDKFKQKMQDQSYATQMHDWISSKDATFSQRRPINTFLQKVGAQAQPEAQLQKKSQVGTELPSEGTSSASLLPADFTMKPSQDLPQGMGKPLELKPLTPLQTKKREGEELKNYNKSLSVITPELISGTEENAVPLLNYHFGQLGFKFEESGMTGDWVTVTAPDGSQKEFSLDNFMSSKDKEEANRLRKFIEGKGAYSQKTFEAKISDTKEANQKIKALNQEFDVLVSQKKQVESDIASSDKYIAELEKTPENQRDKSWQDRYNSFVELKNKAIAQIPSIEESRKSYLTKEAQIQSAAGDYFTMKGEQGTWYGNIANELLEGFSKVAAGTADIFLNTMPYVMGESKAPKVGEPRYNKQFRTDFIQEARSQGIYVPDFANDEDFDSWYSSISLGKERRQEVYDKMLDKSLKKVKYGTEDEEGMLSLIRRGNRTVLGDPNTSVEYTDLSKQSFWGGAIAGLIDFAPAMVGNPIQKTATMFAISNDNMNKEFENNPNFKDVTEGDKLLYAMPFNLANSVLLEFGLNRVMGSQSFVANLVSSSLGKAGAKASAAELKNIMRGEVNNMIGRGVITMTKGALSGAELGATIYTTDVAIKKAINEAKGKEMFETPESFNQFFKEAAQSAASLAAGAGILSVPGAVHASYTKTGYKGMSNESFQLFELASKNDEVQSAFIADLKNKVADGSMTSEQAKGILNSYRNSVGLFNSLPEGLDITAKKEAMDLLKERRALEDKIKGKDEALVKPQRERINQINEQLNKISEDAIQKSEANASVLGGEQPEMGLQEVGEGNAKPEQAQGEEAVTVEKQKEGVALEKPTKEQMQKDRSNGDFVTFKYNTVEEVPDVFKEEAAVSEERKDGKLVEVTVNVPKSLADYELARQEQAAKPKADSEATTAKLEALPVEEKTNITFTQPDGTETPVMGNEKMLADMYHEAINIPEAERTPAQQSAVDATEVSLKTLTPEAEPAKVEPAKAEPAKAEPAKTGATPIEEPKVVVAGTRDGFENLGTTSSDRTNTEWAKDARGREGKFDENGVLIEKDADGNTVINIKQDAVDRFGRRGFLQTSITVPEGANINEGAVRDIVNRNVEQMKKGNDMLDLSKVDRSLFEKMKNEVVDELKNPTKIETAPEVTVEPTAIPKAEPIEEIMTADTTDPSNLKKVYDFLDNLDNKLKSELFGGANDAFKAIPLGTMQVIVKALKAAVKGGMKLQDAIKRVAIDNKVSEDDVTSSLTIIDRMMRNVSEGLSEAELPGFDRMMKEVEGIVKKSKERGADEQRTRENVMEYVKKSKAYEDATDVQREKLVRAVNERFGIKEKAAPSTNRILGKIKDVLKITSSEKSLLKKQIKDLARGARDAKDAIRKAQDELSIEIKKLASSGKITAKQAANVIRAFAKTNILSAKSVDKFTNYMTKVFENAEYADKLSNAKSTQKDLTKLSKNNEKNANLRDLASQFVKIDPALVDDIDTYNEMASKIKESLQGSKIRGKVEFADMVNIEDAVDYVNKTIEEQNRKLYDYAAEDVADMGIDPTDLTYEQLQSLLQGEAKVTKYQATIIRDALRRMFNTNSTIIRSMLDTGVDAFTGERVDYTKTQRDIIKRFMDMDIEKLSDKEAAAAVDALTNFIQNKSTAKMESVVSDYLGNRNAEIVLNKGLTAVKLKKLFSPNLGRLLSEYTTSLPQLFERMFKGVNRGGMVEDYSGVTRLKNGKSKAQMEANNIVKDYVSNFYKKKANGEAFNTRQNNIERKMAAHMMRNVIGTEAEMKTEFNRRKGLIEQSIENLKRGNDLAKEKAELYQKAYDKIVKDSKNIQDIRDKTDDTNLEAVDFWIKEWADRYDEFYDTALNVYNKVLDKDINYTPDKVSNVEGESKEVDLKNEESAFFSRNDNIPKSESSVLMEATGSDKLNKGTYIDLDFDSINANAMYDALVDIRTASAIRQVDAFINSPLFDKIVPTSDDATILKGRIKLYVQNIRNKNPYVNVDELSKTIRRLNKIAAIGVGQSLGGVTQPFKQVIPVAMNTLINARSLDLGAILNPDKNNFVANSGHSIGMRGIESQAQIESINNLINLAAQSKGEKAMKFIEQANKKWLDLLLVKPDVFIARASWLSYYEKGLKKQGIKPKDIDYKTHQLNEEAANYATRMVDRQQNISDHDLAGKLFSNRNETNQAIVKLLMPFASFRLNQGTRLANDLSTIGHWSTSTTEDKAIAAWSLAGFGVEMAVFKAIAGGASLLIGSLTKKIMGQDEDDEEYEKRKSNVIKGQMTSTVTDVLSPLPVLDRVVQGGFHLGVDEIQEMMDIAEKERINIYDASKEDVVKSMGLFGISADRASQFFNLVKLSTTGEFKDEFGQKKWLNVKDKDALKMLILPSLMSNAGLAPSEVSSIVRNAIKFSEKEASTKEGGKTESDLEADKKQKEISEENKKERQDQRDKKIEALRKIKRQGVSEKKSREIDDMIEELSMSDEERKKYRQENKAERIEEKEKYEELLQGYDSKSDMKRYDPDLYERTFGKGSKYYNEHKDENEIEDRVDDILQEEEDKKHNYFKSNKDGYFKKNKKWNMEEKGPSSSKRTYKKSISPDGKSSYESTHTVVDESGNVISRSSRKKTWGP